MVVGSLELAIKDLIERAENVPECDFGFVGNIEAAFEGLSRAFLYGDFLFFSLSKSVRNFPTSIPIDFLQFHWPLRLLMVKRLI